MSRFFVAFLILFLVAAPLHSAQAELRIDITQGNVQPVPVALVPFQAGDAQSAQVAKQIRDVISANLERSGLFKIVPETSYIDRSVSIDTTPRFGDWRGINAPALIIGRILNEGNGQLAVEFRLWDTFTETNMAGRRLKTPAGNWRQIAHIISDEIYSRITGEEGYFNTRVVYIAETGPMTNRVKRLAVMDQDGANVRYLTNGGALTLTPRFSPTMQQITYMSYEGRQPSVYLYNITTGRRELLGSCPGMTFAPRFSPDGRKVVFSLSRSGNSDIYEMDLSTKAKRQLTSGYSIDTAPSYAPDGRNIVFESDRGGSQQLYVMPASGGEPRRITFGEGRYANPVWSPRGDLIAFTKMLKGQFYIGVIRPDGSGERLITKAYHVEGPTWAPNGRVLMYFKEMPTNQGRTARLYSIDLTGRNERVVATPTSASDPAWSPRLK